MNDESVRSTFATESGKYPNCLSEEMKVISNAFDHVDKIVNSIIEFIIGNELKYQDEKNIYDFKNSSMKKEHIHVYTKSKDLDGLSMI